jgi:hypothetical protein
MNIKLKEFLIKNKIDNYISLKKILLEYNNICIQENDEFIILTIYDNNLSNLTKLEYNSYFTIISKNPFRIINNISDYVYVNDNCINLLCKYKLLNYKFDIYESFSGYTITLFTYKDDWKFMSLTNTNSNANKKLFENIINIDKLLKNLNKNYIYTFIIIKKEYNDLVDYSSRFGTNYSRIYHISSKIDNIYLDITNKPLAKYNIFYRNKVNDFTLIDNNYNKHISTIKGLEVQITVDNSLYTFILDSKSYKFSCKLRPNLNKYIGFVHLYQQDLLKNHLIKYIDNNIINNSKFPYEKFNTYDVVNKSFRLLSSELFELFKKVWDINDTSHRDSNLYNFLPTEYKVLLYRIKGIYFQNRQDEKLSIKNEYLDENDIFEYLKKIELELLLKILFIRRKMKNILEKKNIPLNINNSFKNISLKMNKLDLKLIAILTHYLYPEIKRIEV